MTPTAKTQSDSKHLDLGCGQNPRNPYNQSKLYGIDIADFKGDNQFNYSKCNVVLTNLPFEDNTFDSVSAYDFIEHIPREIVVDGNTTFPFIHVMNEVYRVLKPNGKFLALTPAFPKESAFVDPTHVNVITKDTHKYFTQPHIWAGMYGFNGAFDVIRAEWKYFRSETNKVGFVKTFLRDMVCFVYPKLVQHFLWEFRAIK